MSGWLAAVALWALCGAGMGLALSVLGPASLPDGKGSRSRRPAARSPPVTPDSMLGLLLIAPGWPGNWRQGDQRRPGRHGLDAGGRAAAASEDPRAWALRNEIESTPDGEVPDIDAVFAAQGADDSDELAAARDELVEVITSIRRGPSDRRSSSLPSWPCWHWPHPAVASRSRTVDVTARPSLAPIIAAGLITGPRSCSGGRVNRGAQEFGRYEAADPCTALPDSYPGDGLDATVQRIAFRGLNGAACELGTGRPWCSRSIRSRESAT